MYFRTVQRVRVDFKTDASMIQDQIDHAALPQKGLVLTHQKHTPLRQALDGCASFRRRERKRYGTISCPLPSVRVCRQRMSSNDFSGHNGLQHVEKLFLPAANSDHQGDGPSGKAERGHSASFAKLKR